jgi:hypothetical protein
VNKLKKNYLWLIPADITDYLRYLAKEILVKDIGKHLGQPTHVFHTVKRYAAIPEEMSAQHCMRGISYAPDLRVAS